MLTQTFLPRPIGTLIFNSAVNYTINTLCAPVNYTVKQVWHATQYPALFIACGLHFFQNSSLKKLFTDYTINNWLGRNAMEFHNLSEKVIFITELNSPPLLVCYQS